MFCPYCGRAVPDGADACPSCGNVLPSIHQSRPTKFCSACGAQIDAEAEICPKCGVRVAAPGAYQPAFGASYPGTSPYIVAPPAQVGFDQAVDDSALGKVVTFGVLWLIGTGLVLASEYELQGIVSSISGLSNPITLLQTLSNPSGFTYGVVSDLALVVGMVVFAMLIGIASFVVARSSFNQLKKLDPRFSSPASLTRLVYIAFIMIILAIVVPLGIIYSSSGGSPSSILEGVGGAILASAGLAIVGAILFLIGGIGLLLGIWRWGSRYEKGTIKAAVILFLIISVLTELSGIFGYLQVIPPILVVAGAAGARRQVFRAPSVR